MDDLINAVLMDAQFPLERAILRNSPEEVRELLRNGADVNAVADHRRIMYGYTPLLLAASVNLHHSTEIVDMLIRAGADVNKEDTIGYTPLYDASSHGNVDMVRLLLAAGADPNRRVTRMGEIGKTALMAACDHVLGATPLTVQALLDAGADINATHKEFLGTRSALYYAVKKDANHKYPSPRSQVVEILLAAGADVDNVSWKEFLTSSSYSATLVKNRLSQVSRDMKARKIVQEAKLALPGPPNKYGRTSDEALPLDVLGKIFGFMSVSPKVIQDARMKERQESEVFLKSLKSKRDEIEGGCSACTYQARARAARGFLSGGYSRAEAVRRAVAKFPNRYTVR
jgi:ankyrin repeat protein